MVVVIVLAAVVAVADALSDAAVVYFEVTWTRVGRHARAYTLYIYIYVIFKHRYFNSYIQLYNHSFQNKTVDQLLFGLDSDASVFVLLSLEMSFQLLLREAGEAEDDTDSANSAS